MTDKTMTTILQLFGSMVCAIKRQHTDRRVTKSRVIETDSGNMIEHYAARECARCGRIVPVRARGPRKTKETK